MGLKSGAQSFTNFTPDLSSQSKHCLHNNNTNNMLSAVSRNVSVLRTGARSMSTIPVNQIASVLKLNAGGEDKVRAMFSVCPVLSCISCSLCRVCATGCDTCSACDVTRCCR